jgi:hypothetical protein
MIQPRQRKDNTMNDIPSGYVPLEPLEALARSRYEETEQTPWSNNVFAELCGVSNRAVGRWRAAGGVIPWTTADIAAVKLGFHPLIIWPELWLDLDRGLIAGTDEKAIKEYDSAMKKVGEALSRSRHPASA